METATIRELRLNFGAVRRKVEEAGSVVITDNGIPSYLIKALPKQKNKRPALPDYAAHLARQSRPLTAEETRALHQENRGDC